MKDALKVSAKVFAIQIVFAVQTKFVKIVFVKLVVVVILSVHRIRLALTINVKVSETHYLFFLSLTHSASSY